MTGTELIAAERLRQQTEEGFDSDHDDTVNADGANLVKAALCYLMTLVVIPVIRIGESSMPLGGHILSNLWPWNQKWWKPADRKRTLVKAGALIAAALDLMERQCPSQSHSIQPSSSAISSPES